MRWAVQQYRLLFYTARGLVEHGTLVRSAALTFYTLMSIVPVAAVIFAVVKGFGLAETLLDNLYGIFPQHPEVIEYLIGFAERALARTQGGVVAVVALVTLFWAVIRAFASIESAFNNIWEVKTARSLTRQYSAYITIVVVVPLLWAATRGIGPLRRCAARPRQLGLVVRGVEVRRARHDVAHLRCALHGHSQYEGAFPQRADRRRGGGHALHALPVGICLPPALDDLLQRHLRQFRRPAALSDLDADLVADSPFRRRALVRLPERRPLSPWSASRSASATTAGGAPCSP